MWFWTVETDYEKDMERDIEFEVSESWFNNWFDKNRKGTETRGNIENEKYEIPQDFLDDWILDDSVEMYIDAIEDNEVLATRPISEWVSI